MFQDLLHHMGADAHAAAILIFFTAFFVGMIAWVLRPGGAATYSKIAHLPLGPSKSIEASEEEHHV